MAPTGIGYAASTLFGVLYSERDKSGLKHSVWEVLRFGSFVTLIWAAIVFAVLPLLMKVYGMPANHDVRLGSIFQLGFLLFFLVVFVLTIFYESTERFGMSLFLPNFNSYVFLTLIAGKNNLYQCLQDEHCVNRGQ